MWITNIFKQEESEAQTQCWHAFIVRIVLFLFFKSFTNFLKYSNCSKGSRENTRLSSRHPFSSPRDSHRSWFLVCTCRAFCVFPQISVCIHSLLYSKGNILPCAFLLFLRLSNINAYRPASFFNVSVVWTKVWTLIIQSMNIDNLFNWLWPVIRHR